jgi:hypothetical protein
MYGHTIKRADTTEHTNERGVDIIHETNFDFEIISTPSEIKTSNNIEFICIKVMYSNFKSIIVFGVPDRMAAEGMARKEWTVVLMAYERMT